MSSIDNQAVPSHSDVLIVGAGPSGAIASAVLAESGRSVICLEQGDWMNSADYPGDKVEWELASRSSWNTDPMVRHRDADYPIDASESEANPNMFNAVGGTTIVYRAHWTRMLPSDFRVKTLDGVADDWPFTYEDLAPYYDAIDEIVGTAGMGGDPAYPKGSPPPLPAHPIGPMGRKVAQGMNELGWHWWPAPNAIASRKHRGLNPCVRYGACITGCPNDSKASFDLVVWPQALKSGTRLVTGARVRQVTLNAQGLATGVVYIDRDGVEHNQTADVVILAANAIGNARLLLLSACNQFPDGLANSSGLVGKRLMTHPFASVRGIFDDTFESWQGPFGQQIQSMQFYETDDSRDFVRGAKWGLLPSGGPLAMAMNALTGQGEPGVFNPHGLVDEQLGHAIDWGLIAEDLPDENNRVLLHDSLADSDGIPGVKVIAHDDENVKRNLKFQVARAIESFEAAGARKSVVAPRKSTRSHNMGTTVMGADSSASVVDEFCQAHDIPNLYLFGASVFPTGASVNPTATICALALRNTEHMIENWKDQKIPL